MSMQALISNKYPSVGKDARNGEECMNEDRDTWEISVLFIQFLCEPKRGLKISLLKTILANEGNPNLNISTSLGIKAN